MTNLGVNMGSKPEYKIIQKDATTGKWKKIGAAWVSERGGFNLSIGERGQEVKYLMVKDDYEAKRANPETHQDAGRDIEKRLPCGYPLDDLPGIDPLDDSVPF